jgi:hypothetical protein
VLIPFMTHLVPLERRGRMVGNVMAGLLTGIMLARPIALFIAASFGWRAVFWISAVLMVGIGAALAWLMPTYKPSGRMHYGQILMSMAGLLHKLPFLRWRAVYQALMFAAFNMFWTAAPLMLAERFELGEHGIGLFALAGGRWSVGCSTRGTLRRPRLHAGCNSRRQDHAGAWVLRNGLGRGRSSARDACPPRHPHRCGRPGESGGQPAHPLLRASRGAGTRERPLHDGHVHRRRTGIPDRLSHLPLVRLDGYGCDRWLDGGLLCCSSECSRNWHRRGPAIGRREPSPQWGA